MHENGAYGQKLLPETMGGGCAFLDFDNDGDQDLLFVNSARWPWDPRPDPESKSTLVLYRNDGRGHFEDVTAGSGLDVSCYGMGAAVGDFDGDGWVDVFVSAVGRNRLFRNLGDGRYADVTEQAGVGGDAGQWSTSCGWFDYDNDGDLDLFVANYVHWSRELDEEQNFQMIGGGRAYGRPQNFDGSFPYLYRNDGQGHFHDVSAEAGIQIRDPQTGRPLAKSLGVTFADVDDDGWMDIVVANDTVQNFLFRNRGDGTFSEIGALAGVAFDVNGGVRGAMGVDVARFRNDGALGIAIGNFSNEMTALYVSARGTLQFADEAVALGLGPHTRQELTFGVTYLDYDLDSRLDLLTANGHLEQDIQQVQPSQRFEQPPQLFWNGGASGSAEFVPVPVTHCGDDLARPLVGRGVSYADIDNDGDLDVLITAVGRPPRLLRNDQALQHHWLRLELVGVHANRSGIGAWIEVQTGDQIQRRQVMPTRSYLSQVELPVTFGLGDATRIDRVTVFWPDGTTQRLNDVRPDRAYRVQQAADAAAVPAPTPPRVTVAPTESVLADTRSMTQIGEGERGCGSHLLSPPPTVATTSQSADAHGPTAPAPPCHGPNCSGAPPGPVPATPHRTWTVDFGAVLAGDPPREPDPPLGALGTPELHPMDPAELSVFRPPRCS